METRQIVLAVTILLGIYFLGDAIYDQSRSIAKVFPVRHTARVKFHLRGGYEIASKEKDPDRFKELMTYQWLQAFVVLLIGYGIFRLYENADRTDPFSSGFHGWSDDDKPHKS